jgi:hypothetical protein
MGPLAELLSAGQGQILDFFVSGLRDVSEPSVDERELFYNGSVLAHYAQTSTSADGGLPAPLAISSVFDHFVLSSELAGDGQMMETAGAQCLLLAGFFEDQSKTRHNIRWYSQLGATFFARAARAGAGSPRGQLLSSIALGFEPWRQRHARLSRELRTMRLLLTLPQSG